MQPLFEDIACENARTPVFIPGGGFTTERSYYVPGPTAAHLASFAFMPPVQHRPELTMSDSTVSRAAVTQPSRPALPPARLPSDCADLKKRFRTRQELYRLAMQVLAPLDHHLQDCPPTSKMWEYQLAIAVHLDLPGDFNATFAPPAKAKWFKSAREFHQLGRASGDLCTYEPSVARRLANGLTSHLLLSVRRDELRSICAKVSPLLYPLRCSSIVS
jgi:hypothetical protein